MLRLVGVFVVLLAVYAATLPLDAPGASGERYGPREVHVLLTARSLADDRSFEVSDEYRDGAWRAFTDSPPRPTADLVDGRLVEPQGVGFPLLVAPAYALGGATLVRLLCAALLALAFALAVPLARRVVGEPWATGSAVVLGLSPPALLAATSVSPEGACAALLTGGAVAALSVRERIRKRTAFAAAACVALVPWLWMGATLPAIVIALALARWLRRRRRGLAGFVTLEIVLLSAVVFITFHDRVFGGPTPYASSAAGGWPGMGASSAVDLLERLPRVAALWVGREEGLVPWVPFALLAFAGLLLLWRSHRDRLSVALPERVDVEVAAAFLGLLCAAQAFATAILAPAMAGAWSPARLMLCAAPLAAGLCAWGWQRFRRTGHVLAALTLVAGGWALLGGLAFGGAQPWGGAERLLPVFGAQPWPLTAAQAAACVVVVAAVLLVADRERRRPALI